MSQLPPLPPDNQSSAAASAIPSADADAVRSAKRARMRKLIVGFVIGSVISALCWIVGWNALVDRGGALVLIAVPTIKLVFGLGLMASPRARPLGVGVLLSIAMGALIFFGSCAAHFEV